MHVRVLQSEDKLLVRFVGIVHFDLRHIPVAGDGPAGTVRLNQRYDEIILADKDAFEFLPAGAKARKNTCRSVLGGRPCRR